MGQAVSETGKVGSARNVDIAITATQIHKTNVFYVC